MLLPVAQHMKMDVMAQQVLKTQMNEKKNSENLFFNLVFRFFISFFLICFRSIDIYFYLPPTQLFFGLAFNDTTMLKAFSHFCLMQKKKLSPIGAADKN
jgi:hypothetical protein